MLKKAQINTSGWVNMRLTLDTFRTIGAVTKKDNYAAGGQLIGDTYESKILAVLTFEPQSLKAITDKIDVKSQSVQYTLIIMLNKKLVKREKLPGSNGRTIYHYWLAE